MNVLGLRNSARVLAKVGLKGAGEVGVVVKSGFHSSTIGVLKSDSGHGSDAF